MKQESALAKAMMPELFSGAIQMKHKYDCLKKTSQSPKSFMIHGVACYLKTSGVMTAITSTNNEREFKDPE